MATTQVESTIDLITYYRATHHLTAEEQQRVGVLVEPILSILGKDGPSEIFMQLATALFNCGYEAGLRCSFPTLDDDQQ
jgi:hypothetical protein